MYSLYVSGRNKQLEQLKKISETDYQYQLVRDRNEPMITPCFQVFHFILTQFQLTAIILPLLKSHEKEQSKHNLSA